MKVANTFHFLLIVGIQYRGQLLTNASIQCHFYDDFNSKPKSILNRCHFTTAGWGSDSRCHFTPSGWGSDTQCHFTPWGLGGDTICHFCRSLSPAPSQIAAAGTPATIDET